ncbi:unnamed protein product [Blepharisma stoltei]|uniref:Uncharacterized protein n=1 Tax=Blepharisma stoltei TaxID=1481888 RepID=A0AAU9KGU4_9CILI|nr:unnamed protein product [Blepharisma stoltei]
MIVNYSKPEILATWFESSINQRKDLLTYRDENLITLINYVNTSLMLTSADQIKDDYELLGLIDTYWSDPAYMQVRPSAIKGNKLTNLISEKYPEFLVGEKVFYNDEGSVVKIFQGEIKSWKHFQLSICMLLEQSFLKCHYTKLTNQAEKIAQKLLCHEKVPIKKKKDKVEIENPPIIYDACNVRKQSVEKETLKNLNCEEIALSEKSISLTNDTSQESTDSCNEVQNIINSLQNLTVEPEVNVQVETEDYSSYDMKNLIFEVFSDISTQADTDIEKDIFETLIFNENSLGGRSYKLRKIYSSKAIVWDEEMKQILSNSYNEIEVMNDPYTSFNEYSIVRDYYQNIRYPYLNMPQKFYNFNQFS